jgi:hypothetical protein
MMIYKTFLLILVLSVSLTAFPEAPQQKLPVPTADLPEEPAPVLSVLKDYHYNGRGRRNPIGDALYDGIIKSIKADGVTLALTASNADPKLPREIVRKLRSGEQR